MGLLRAATTISAAILLASCGDGGRLAPTQPLPAGMVSGRVTDIGGSRPEVVVTLSQLGVEFDETVTNQQGEYEFRGLEPGEYAVSISRVGNWGSCSTRRSVTVLADMVSSVDFVCDYNPWDY